jgi:outer membrane receptor for Fe3+-dicitrate
MSQKRFIVKNNHKKLPNWFLNFNSGKRYIWVVSCHVKPTDLKGFTLHSTLNSNDFNDNDDNWICYCNEYFEKKRFTYNDIHMLEINLKLKDEEENEIDLNDREDYKAPRFRLELMLETVEE